METTKGKRKLAAESLAKSINQAYARKGADLFKPATPEPVGEQPPTCILTGAQGEDPDDCTTHEHEPVGERAQQCSQCGAELLPDIGHSDYQKHVCQRAQHSQLPWRMVRRGPDSHFRINILPFGGIRSIADVIEFGCREQTNQYAQINTEQEANARFIVTAVNNHQALVDALKALLKSFNIVPEEWATVPSVSFAIADARAALAAIEGSGKR